MNYIACVLSVLMLMPIAALGQDPNLFRLPGDGSNVIGQIQHTIVREGETLLDIAERYGLGFTDIVAANPELDAWIPEVGAQVVVPTQYILPDSAHEGVVVNLAEFRLYYFLPEQQVVFTYPIGIGHDNTPTPLGRMHIKARIENPTWYPPASIRATWEQQGREVRRQIPAGPDNPLGPYAISLSQAGYLIHGTNQRFGIGTRASAGCIRMNNRDIKRLVENTYIGVNVNIIDQPVKAGWDGQQMMLEVHMPASFTANIHTRNDMITTLVAARARRQSEQIDWDQVDKVYLQQRGIPFAVNIQMPHDKVQTD